MRTACPPCNTHAISHLPPLFCPGSNGLLVVSFACGHLRGDERHARTSVLLGGGEGAGVFFVTFGPGTRPLWPVLAFCVWLPDMASRGRGPLVRYCTPERPGPQMWSCSPMPKQPKPSRLVRPEICSLPTQAPSLPGRSGARSSLRAHNRDRLCHPRCAPPSFP